MNSHVSVANFGTLPDGRNVNLYELTNSKGSRVKILDYGTIITELHVPDRTGKFGDVVLGFDHLAPYIENPFYFGCTVGRVANRIAGGKFTLDHKPYSLAVNNGNNHLHGGLRGFDKALWKAEPQNGAAVKFSHTSPDGDEGYPGALKAEVTIQLTDADELSIDYTAATEKPTIVNLTNHSYFNLAGAGTILGHEMMISAAYYTPSADDGIPTGELRRVSGTPMDFTIPRPIGSRFQELKGDPVGYDNNYVINRAGKGLALAARVYEPSSGRAMEVQTTQPGMQFYTGNFLGPTVIGKNRAVYDRHTGFCLETQHYPDSINHPEFPSVTLRPGQAYRHATVFKFSTR